MKPRKVRTQSPSYLSDALSNFRRNSSQECSGKFREQAPASLPEETKTLNPGYKHLLSLSHFVNEYKLSNKLLLQVNRYYILKGSCSHVFSHILLTKLDTTHRQKEHL